MAGESGLGLRPGERQGSGTRSEEPIRPGRVARLAWPIAVQMLSYTAMGLVDALFVGQLGTAALAAVGLGSTVGHLVQAGGIGLVSGTRVAVSQAHGAEEPERARLSAWSGIRLAALLGAIAPLACFGVGPLLTVLGAEGDVWRIAVEWSQVRILAVPFLLGTVALSGWFQGRGDTRTPMVATLVANGVNIALDPLLIFGWGPFVGIGAVGAAASTVAGSASGLLVLAIAARQSLETAPGRASSALRRVLELGMPIGVRYLLEVGAFGVFAALLASVGEAALAAHIVVIRVVSVSFLPGHAVGEAASVLVGQAVGAGSRLRARTAWSSATLVATVVMGAFAVVFVAVPDLLLVGFSLEPEVLVVASDLMLLAAAFQVMDAVAMVGLGALAGAGETRFTMVLGVAAGWLVKLPLGAVLVLWTDLGAAGAWWGLMAEIAVVAVIVVVRVRRAPWARLAS